MARKALAAWLERREAADPIRELLSEMLAEVPKSQEFAASEWDVSSWPGCAPQRTMTLRFAKIVNTDLRAAAKLWILHGRITSDIAVSTAKSRLTATQSLDHALGERALQSLTTGDFRHAERLLIDQYSNGTAARSGAHLSNFSRWLAINFGLRLNYKCQLRVQPAHGRLGDDEGRIRKLLPTEVLRDLVAATHRKDLNEIDQFYLPVLTLNLALGLRISEMARLPLDCLVREQYGLTVRYIPVKSTRAVPRPVHPAMARVVEEAVAKLARVTDAARTVAKQKRGVVETDWSKIIKSPDAFRYFVSVWANEWTSDKRNQIINPDGAWHQKENRFIDVIGILKEEHGNKSAAARRLGLNRNMFYRLLVAQEAALRGDLPPVQASGSERRGHQRNSWDTDVRVISRERFKKHIKLAVRSDKLSCVGDIIDAAQAAQLRGESFPRPPRNSRFESQYTKSVVPVVTDRSGRALLWPDEMLLVLRRYEFASSRAMKEDDFRARNDSDISRWLAGEARSRGTCNHEDSVFSRLQIIDPRTGEIAKFTWHDIRHWLDTAYENGGLTQDQIAMIFGRSTPLQNAVYDQTTRTERINRLREGVRNKKVFGTIAETYNAMLDKNTREEAEEVLKAGTSIVNSMPHGNCTLNWGTEPCPNHTSCLSSQERPGEPCEHLVVDPLDSRQTEELARIEREATLAIETLKEQGATRQAEHYTRVAKAARSILNKLKKIVTKK